VSEIIIVDSFSMDKTLEIARKFTNTIYQHKYEGHPQQWQWILNNISIQNNWIFAIDADFIITKELLAEINKRFNCLDEEISGFYVRHKEVFKGRAILHGGIYPSYWMRIFRKDRVNIDINELVDVHFFVNGKTENLEFDIFRTKL